MWISFLLQVSCKQGCVYPAGGTTVGTFAIPRFRVYIARNSPYRGSLQECVKYLYYNERNSL
jgi:hypothetical protein